MLDRYATKAGEKKEGEEDKGEAEAMEAMEAPEGAMEGNLSE